MQLCGRLRVAIAGAGSTGLGLATLLRKRGHEVSIYEKFAVAQPLGSGLLLQPTGLAVLAHIGALGDILKLGAKVQRLDGRTVDDRCVFDLNYDILGHGAYGVGVHRTSLFTVLLEHATAAGARIHTSFDVDATMQHSDHTVSVRSLCGASAGPFDLVVDCSGRHSKLVCDDPDQRFGQDKLQQRYDDASLMVGAMPIGLAPGSAMHHIAFFWSLPARLAPTFRSQSIHAWRAQVIQAWPAMAPFVKQFDSLDQLAFAEYGHKQLESRCLGRVAFAGDAAHSMSPQLGQGANLGLLDALALARAIGDECTPQRVPAALQEYDRSSRRHAVFYGYASKWLTPFFQSDSQVAAVLRDATFARACRTPWLRLEMMRSLAGMKTGLLSHVEPGQLHESFVFK